MSTAPKVTVGVILFKGEKYLKHSLGSLVAQDYPNVEFLFRDQSPNGEAYEYVKREMPEVFEKATMEKGENLMHSGGHNALIERMMREGGDYYVCASNDMLYPPDFLSRMMNEMEKMGNKHFGSATCKVMHWDFDKAEKGDPTGSKTNIIDSCGITLTRGHHFSELGQGEEDTGQYDAKKEIFGASGALAIYRRSALNTIRYTSPDGQKEYFDSLLHYKNDVDLSYRLQWAGQKCLLLPSVKVWHHRQVGNLSKAPLLVRILKARKGKSRFASESSFYGQQTLMKKNFDRRFSFGVRLRTSLYNAASVKYAMSFEPYLIKQIFRMRKDRAKIEDRREKMVRNIPPKEIEALMQ